MPQMTGAGILLPKPTENDWFYSGNLEHRQKKVQINNKKAIQK